MESKVQRPSLLLSPISVSSQSRQLTMNVSPCSQKSVLSSVLDLDNGVVSGRFKGKSLSKADSSKFTLQRWKEYALLRHGDHERFLKTPHGRRIIAADALRAYNNDLKSMVLYTDEVERLAKETEDRIIEEQGKRKVAEDMVIAG